MVKYKKGLFVEMMLKAGEIRPFIIHMKVLRQLLFGFFIGLIFVNATFALPEDPPKGFFIVADYKYDWLVFSSQYANYIPFSKGINEDAGSVSAIVDLIKNRRYYMLLRSENDGHLFIEGTLQKRIMAGEWLEFSIDSLYRGYKTDELLVTIYGASGISGKTLLICNKTQEDDKEIVTRSASFVNIRPIIRSHFGDLSLIAFMIILLVSGILYNLNPVLLGRLVAPTDFLSRDTRDQLSKVVRPFNANLITFVVVLSLILSFVLLYLFRNVGNIFSLEAVLSDQDTVVDFIRDYIVLSLIFVGLFFGKYVMINVVGNMLNMGEIADTLFLKIIQSSFIFFSVVFLFFLVLTHSNLPPGEWWKSNILTPFLTFYAVRFVSLYLVVRPAGSVINVYLFSYLCVVEVIPLIIGLKFAW